MMKQTLKFLLLLSIAALVVGCKLAVIVVEGGEVRLMVRVLAWRVRYVSWM